MEWGVGARGVSGDALNFPPRCAQLCLCVSVQRTVVEVGIGKQSNWIDCELPLVPRQRPFIPTTYIPYKQT